jgi:iron complex transport system substrate-binding protein
MKKRMLAALLLFTLLLSACAGAEKKTVGNTGAPEIAGLTYESAMKLQYAKCFQVYRYQGGYEAIRVSDGRDYLVIPEGGTVPKGAKGFIILQKPLDKIYLAATGAMSLVCALGKLGSVALSGAKQKEWYIPEAAKAMADGSLPYAGKYSEPDYELLTSKGCDLAVESTMILHTPQVQEKIEELGIPVFIDRSSYETHPLGRTEWLKLYGALLDEEDKAAALFAEQAKIVDSLSDFKNTEKTVAFFYVTTAGTVAVRKSSDYLASMIELAGGRYIFKDLGDPNTATSGVNMTMEEFYASAKDADYLIYNAAIDSPLTSVDELLQKSKLFADFKAVKNGNVWCTGKYLYQATDVLGYLIEDIHTMLTDESQTQLKFIHKLS